jgi:hypothetical protein
MLGTGDMSGAHRRAPIGPAVLMSLALAAGCAAPGETPSPPGPTPSPADEIALEFDFRQGAQGWETGFSDYTEDVRPEDPVAGIQELPPGVPDDLDGPGMLIAATNRPDDLFMFLKRALGPAEGISPDTPYQVRFRIDFLSDAPSNCAGIGGPPGEAVYMKAGATTEEPLVVEQNGAFRMNVDKGNQAADGPAATHAGDVANGIPCEEALAQDPQPFAQVVHESVHETLVTADDEGRLWLLVGTDSGFEGRTTLVYRSIEVYLEPAPN